MYSPSPWHHDIQVIRHHEYVLKPAFERASDTYGQWAAFALTEGAFEFRIGGVSGSAASGDLVACPPGALFERRSERPISFHYFLFHWLDKNGKSVAGQEFPGPVHLSFRSRERFRSTLATLSAAGSMNRRVFPLWQSHALLDLFRLFDAERDALPGADETPLHDPLMEQARSRLDAACEVPVSIRQVAESLGLTPVQFARRFEKASGMKPSAYAERVKLDKVCRLLTHTAMTLEQIAQASGFSSAFYLSRLFSKRIGVAPSVYRSQYRL